MISNPPLMALLFFVVWAALGALLGLIARVAMTWLFGLRGSRAVVDLILGAMGSVLGALVSGWASQHTFNSGALRTYYIWDETGRAVDWKTAIAEHQLLIAVLGAILLVACSHSALAVYNHRSDKSLR